MYKYISSRRLLSLMVYCWVKTVKNGIGLFETFVKDCEKNYNKYQMYKTLLFYTIKSSKSVSMIEKNLITNETKIFLINLIFYNDEMFLV